MPASDSYCSPLYLIPFWTVTSIDLIVPKALYVYLLSNPPVVFVIAVTFFAGISKIKKDIVVLETKKGFETLSAIYSRNCVKIIEENLKEGVFKVSDIFPYQNTLILGEDIIKKHKIDELNFFNINTIKDYAFLQNKYNEQKESFPQYWKKTFFRKQA